MPGVLWFLYTVPVQFLAVRNILFDYDGRISGKGGGYYLLCRGRGVGLSLSAHSVFILRKINFSTKFYCALKSLQDPKRSGAGTLLCHKKIYKSAPVAGHIPYPHCPRPRQGWGRVSATSVRMCTCSLSVAGRSVCACWNVIEPF